MKNAGIKKLTLKSLLNGNLTVTKAFLKYLKKTSLIIIKHTDTIGATAHSGLGP